ncbi:MAG: serpin family protein [Sedimentisphaerales bacterium]|nr:serpin family protein [Sedimentisphaerales bacterium]
MKTVRNAVLVVVLVSIAVSCGAIEPIPSRQNFVEGNNKFALELYQKLQDKQGNLFLSPYSISTALAMTFAGARGETERQMAKTLQFPATIRNERFHKVFGSIISQLNSAGEKGGFELVVANALWGQKDYKFKDDFLTLVKSNYEGSLEQVDFVKQTEEARKTINDWVENKTKDKIKELIKPGLVDAMTRLVLTNAIYFKGKWALQFKPEQTKDAPFNLRGGEKTTVPMMSQTERFGYTEANNVQVLEMPYVSNTLSMVILLPKENEGIKDLEKNFTVENLTGWLGKLRKREVQVFIPRFKLTSEFELAEVLASMGMPDVFSAKADFSGMTGARDLFISAVVHKAYVDVNEEGTEAAAATGVGMKLTAIPAPPPVFRADHPFIFLIRDNQTGSILFMGRCANPKSD